MSASHLLQLKKANSSATLQAWLLGFGIGNSVLFCLLGLSFLKDITLYQGLIWLFLILAWLGHFGLLATLPSLLLLPLAWLLPKRRFIMGLAIGISTLSAMLLFIDSIIYRQYHFHINGVIWSLWWSPARGQIFDFSGLELGLSCSILIILLIVEICYARWLWRYLLVQVRPFKGSRVIISYMACLGFSYLIFLLSNAQLVSPLGQQAQALPLYNLLFSKVLPINNSFTLLEEMGQTNFQQARQIVRPLHYPRHVLHCQRFKPALNVLLIVIDSWRFDMMNSRVSPHIARFSQGASQYFQHFSGGNATSPGIFSLFYGLPYQYWSAMLEQRRGAIFLNELLQQGYQVKLFASAPLTQPDFQRTVFKDISQEANTLGKTVLARDQNITQSLINFLQQRNTQQAFFSFLFYDAVHSYCDSSIPQTYFKPAAGVCDRLWLTQHTPAKPYINRYQNSLRLVDEMLGRVFKTLSNKQLLDNTVVILTSDHGQEFNDNALGFWGHASNFTRYQLQVPLLIYWPHQVKRDVWSVTTHYQIIPTLMKRVLGCSNPSSDYSIGQALENSDGKPYFLASSYIDLGIIEPQQITTIFANGDYMISDTHGQVLPKAKLSKALLKQALFHLKQFFN
jgi:uncharacterized protein